MDGTILSLLGIVGSVIFIGSFAFIHHVIFDTGKDDD